MAERSKAADCKSVGTTPSLVRIQPFSLNLVKKLKKKKKLNLTNINLFRCVQPLRNINKMTNLYLIKMRTALNFASYIINYITLNINFKRNRFFPFIKKDNEMDTIINSSLGMISNFFSKKKCFLRSKTAYILLSSFLRKILIYSNFSRIILKIQKKPIYLIEIMKCILQPSKKLYKYPYNNTVEMDEEKYS